MAAKRAKGAEEEPPAEQPQPGTAVMAQGQPGAGVEPPAVIPPGAAPEGRPSPEMPQPDKLVTGAEALEEQQQNPELEDRGSARGT